jgi:MFS family permease
MISKIGARKTMLIAAVAASLVNLGWASLQNLPMFYVISFLAGFVMAGTTLVPSQTLVTTWFDKYRGRAMAIALLGIGFGGMVLPWFNTVMIQTIGWRLAWVVGAAFVWVFVLPLIVVFVRTKPQDLGLLPDGEPPDESAQQEIVGLSVADAIKTFAFPLLVGIYLTQLVGQSIINFHFVPFAVQQGQFTDAQASVFYGLAIGFSVVGKVLFGWLADRFSPAILSAICGFLAAVGPLALWFFIIQSGSTNPLVLSLHAIPYGIGYGGQIILVPVLVGRCFGPLNFGKIQGLVMLGFAVGIIVGIPWAGGVFDRTASYAIPLIAAAAVFAASGVFSLLVNPNKYTSRFTTG